MVHAMVQARREERNGGGTLSRARRMRSSVTTGACARKNSMHRPKEAWRLGCMREKAYSWKAPDMAKATRPAAAAGRPRAVRGVKTVRRKRPCISRFQRRDQNSEIDVEASNGERNMTCGVNPQTASRVENVSVNRVRKRKIVHT